MNNDCTTAKALQHTIAAVAAMLMATPLLAADKVDFGKDLYPILKDRCLGCHAAAYTDAKTGRLKKPKHGLRLDTPEWIKKGYEDDEGAVHQVVISGKPDDSEFYTLTTLDPDHDDIMPPKGDPLTQAQQDVIKAWIAQGAEYGGFQAPEYVNPKAK
jgi:hypothetical protein